MISDREVGDCSVVEGRREKRTCLGYPPNSRGGDFVEEVALTAGRLAQLVRAQPSHG